MAGGARPSWMERRLEGEAASGEGISRESKQHRVWALWGHVTAPQHVCVCVWVCSVRGSQGHTLRQNGHRQSSGDVKRPESAPLNPLQGTHPPLETVWGPRHGGSRLAEGPEVDMRTSTGSICSAGAFS